MSENVASGYQVLYLVHYRIRKILLYRALFPRAFSADEALFQDFLKDGYRYVNWCLPTDRVGWHSKESSCPFLNEQPGGWPMNFLYDTWWIQKYSKGTGCYNSNFDVTVLTNLEVQQQQSKLLQNIGQSGELLLTVNYICALGKHNYLHNTKMSLRQYLLRTFISKYKMRLQKRSDIRIGNISNTTCNSGCLELCLLSPHVQPPSRANSRLRNFQDSQRNCLLHRKEWFIISI